MFRKPKELAHLSFILVILGLIFQSIAAYILDENPFMIGLSLVLYLSAFPFSVIALMRNWRVPKPNRLDLWCSIEVGVGLLPFLITIILVSYALWFI
ncbi:hypothetical protein DRQ33_05140 [bacterium]|nr:MAG: hypothetical protein DRQ33_05140 [bacterium]